MNSEIYPGEERAPVMQKVGVSAGGGCCWTSAHAAHARAVTCSTYLQSCKRGPANQRGILRYIQTPKFQSCHFLFGSRRIKSHAEIFAWNTKSNENDERGSEERSLWFWTEYKKLVIASDSFTMASLKSLRTASAKLSLLTLRRSLRSAIVGEAHPIPWRQRIL